MLASSPEHAVHLLDEAINRGDIEALMKLYDDQALVTPQPDAEARGTDAIRAMYGHFLQPGVSAHQLVTRVLQADNIALFLSHWTLTTPNAPAQTFTATVVFRKGSDGGWKALIDNPCGPLLLEVPSTTAAPGPDTHA